MVIERRALAEGGVSLLSEPFNKWGDIPTSNY